MRNIKQLSILVAVFFFFFFGIQLFWLFMLIYFDTQSQLVRPSKRILSTLRDKKELGELVQHLVTKYKCIIMNSLINVFILIAYI
jgi:hypothetical protein